MTFWRDKKNTKDLKSFLQVCVRSHKTFLAHPAFTLIVVCLNISVVLHRVGDRNLTTEVTDAGDVFGMLK
jgi:hypothetical protein